MMTYSTTPELLKTVAAVATATGMANATAMVTSILTASQSAPLATFTGAANVLSTGNCAGLAGVFGLAAFLV